MSEASVGIYFPFQMTGYKARKADPDIHSLRSFLRDDGTECSLRSFLRDDGTECSARSFLRDDMGVNSMTRPLTARDTLWS
jgi:hypothetical protein